MLQNMESYQYILKTALGIFIKTKYARNNIISLQTSFILQKPDR